MKQSENTTSNAMQSFGDYVNKNYNPSLYPKYYLYKNCDSPLVHIDQIKIEYNKLYPDTATKEQAPEPSTPVLEGKEGFTGGEWRRNGSEIVTGEYPDPHKVIGCVYGLPESEANTRLLVESKNMYYLLKEWMEINDTCLERPFEIGAKELSELVEQAKAIINRIANK